MTNEPEMDVLDGTSAADGVQTPNDSGETRTMMEVTYQKNPNQKYKYLEAEPKILGVTEIMLTAFFIGWRMSFYMEYGIHKILTILSSVGIIAGSVAIAAQKLHIPTLKACLGIQIVTGLVHGLRLVSTYYIYEEFQGGVCHIHHYNTTEEPSNGKFKNMCFFEEHASFLAYIVVVAMIGISITLAAHCCKVIQSCSPRSHVPIIAIKSTAP